MIYGFVGSTMVACELASYLKSEGAHVDFYTHYQALPASQLLSDIDVSIIDDPMDSRLELKNYDYIWVHSQVLPERIIRGLAEKMRPKKLPSFIYLHMSIMDWIPDEKSYIWMLEEKISSKTLFAWEEVRGKQLNELLKSADLNYGIYQNPAPKGFSLLEYNPRKKLKKILFIGNQLPDQVIELQQLLETDGYTTKRYGASGDSYGRITPELLGQFDLVVTGSKSAYYCLCAGVPIYIYNYFGRQGYVNEDNIKDSIKRNFSGRGYEMVSAKVAFADLVENYGKACEFYTSRRKEFIELFSIDKVLPKIIKSTKNREIGSFDKKYTEMVIANLKLSRRLFINESERGRLQQEYDLSVKQVDDIEKVTEDEIRSLKEEIYKLRSSTSFRIGSVVTAPFRKSRTYLREKIQQKKRDNS